MTIEPWAHGPDERERPVRDGDEGGDTAYDAMIERNARIDAGWECPTCCGTVITLTTSLKLPLFHCERCGAEWFDCVTQPTMEAV
jgi:hypothetical protein